MPGNDPDEPALAPGITPRLAELAERQRAHVVTDLAELRADVWGSDKELAAFLADLQASRNASAGLVDDPA